MLRWTHVEVVFFFSFVLICWQWGGERKEGDILFWRHINHCHHPWLLDDSKELINSWYSWCEQRHNVNSFSLHYILATALSKIQRILHCTFWFYSSRLLSERLFITISISFHFFCSHFDIVICLSAYLKICSINAGFWRSHFPWTAIDRCAF